MLAYICIKTLIQVWREKQEVGKVRIKNVKSNMRVAVLFVAVCCLPDPFMVEIANAPECSTFL
jgi:hypothetical protein